MHQLKLVVLFFNVFTILSTQWAFCNTVDELKTDNDVLKFVLKFNGGFKKDGKIAFSIIPSEELLSLPEHSAVARQLDIKTWEKVDFNQDGYTDLLVTVLWTANKQLDLFTLIDQGNDSYKIATIMKSPFDGYQIAKPVIIKNQQTLIYYAKKYAHPQKEDNNNNAFNDQATWGFDTLIYKFGGFIDANAVPANYRISSIHFETGGCYGECPIFELDIWENGRATYNAIKFNPEKGIFNGNINPHKLDELKELISYISIKKLADNYRVNWTDDQTVKIKVKFNDGTAKSITDYGHMGTFGLNKLYSLLFKLRASEIWE